ncbi:MAG: Mut7-C RNAse domain-containing protein [Candidatus Hadarchaeales archaeon]
MRFVADGMLGRLARWLRLTGHDVVYINELDLPPEKQDEFLLAQASKGLVLLTSDLRLYRKSRRSGFKAVLIQASKLSEQLLEVSKALPELEVDLEKSRCPVCNGELEEAERGEVEGLVPRTVLERQENFWRCVQCGKIYWQGTHWRNILETLEEFRRRRNGSNP